MTLQERRIRANFTKVELSKRTGLSVALLSMIESGKRKITPRTAIKLADVYKLKRWTNLMPDYDKGHAV